MSVRVARFVQRRVAMRRGALILPLVLAAGLVAVDATDLPELPPGAEPAWSAYVEALEGRRARELANPTGFLAMDFTPEAAQERQAVLNGDLVIQRVEAPVTGEPAVEIPDARVHHWRGAAFLPGMTVAGVLAALEKGLPPQDDVVRSAILSRGPDELQVYLRLRRRQIVTVVYDTEHVVRFVRHATDKASSTSVATRIVEIEQPGTPEERPRAHGEDRGFLWRLRAYWRYEQVAGGVIAECESVSLSRDVPWGLGVVAHPLITRAARESMEAALLALQSIR
jgi:hypothetical protein